MVDLHVQSNTLRPEMFVNVCENVRVKYYRPNFVLYIHSQFTKLEATLV